MAQTCVNYNLAAGCRERNSSIRSLKSTLEIELKSLPFAITFYDYEVSFLLEARFICKKLARDGCATMSSIQ